MDDEKVALGGLFPSKCPGTPPTLSQPVISELQASEPLKIQPEGSKIGRASGQYIKSNTPVDFGLSPGDNDPAQATPTATRWFPRAGDRQAAVHSNTATFGSGSPAGRCSTSSHTTNTFGTFDVTPGADIERAPSAVKESPRSLINGTRQVSDPWLDKKIVQRQFAERLNELEAGRIEQSEWSGWGSKQKFEELKRREGKKPFDRVPSPAQPE